jgi:hypothetical protein
MMYLKDHERKLFLHTVLEFTCKERKERTEKEVGYKILAFA